MLDFKTCSLDEIIEYIYKHHQEILERDGYHCLSAPKPDWMVGDDYQIEIGTHLHVGGEGGWYTIYREVYKDDKIILDEKTFDYFYV